MHQPNRNPVVREGKVLGESGGTPRPRRHSPPQLPVRGGEDRFSLLVAHRSSLIAQPPTAEHRD